MAAEVPLAPPPMTRSSVEFWAKEALAKKKQQNKNEIELDIFIDGVYGINVVQLQDTFRGPNEKAF